MWACFLIKSFLIKLVVFHFLNTSALQVLLQMTTLVLPSSALSFTEP